MPTYDADIEAEKETIDREPVGDIPEDTAPKTEKKATRKPPKKSTDKQIEDALNEIWIGIGGVTMSFDPWCGATVIQNGPQVSEALVELSKKNPKVRDALESFTTVSAWGAVAGAVAGVLLPIAAHHHLLPPALGVQFGPDHETLESMGVDAEQIYQQMMGVSPTDSNES